MHTYRDCKTLEELWAKVNDLNKTKFPGHELMPIMGNGKTIKPKFMFVFINPTIRNISSSPDWIGPRFPFIGTKQVWNVFNRAGWLDDKIAYRIKHGTKWDLNFTRTILKELKDNSFYFTNIVKWCGHDAALPKKDTINLFLPILEREIELVKPEYIVAFGLIPFEHLTRRKLKLEDYFNKAWETKKLATYDCRIGDQKAKVIPCYFPVGRGNPARAVEILKMLKTL